MERLQKRYPELFQERDTQIVFSSKTFERDTVFYSSIKVVKDTFRIDSIGYIYIHRYIQGDSIGFNLKTPSDTIIVPIKQVILPDQTKEITWSRIKAVGIFLAILYVLSIFANLWKR